MTEAMQSIPFQGERVEWAIDKPFSETLLKLRSTL